MTAHTYTDRLAYRANDKGAAYALEGIPAETLSEVINATVRHHVRSGVKHWGSEADALMQVAQRVIEGHAIRMSGGFND